MTPRLVFVYGTLKAGHGNHGVLEDSEYLGSFVTKDEFLLTDCGFPYLIPKGALGGSGRGPTAPTRGEVYVVTEKEVMASLDTLEGVECGHYKHTPISVLDEEGFELGVLAYTPCEPEMAALYPNSSKNEKGEYEWRG